MISRYQQDTMMRQPFAAKTMMQNRKENPVLTKGILSLIDKISIPNATFLRGQYSADLVHFEQQDEWSCGYRNLQMLLSSILPNIPTTHSLFKEDGNHKIIPNIMELQRLFEMSWREGFDRDGARHFNYKIQGSRAQIGAVEAASLLSFLSIDSVVVQFEKSRQHEWKFAAQFIWNYFSKPCQCESFSDFDSFSMDPPESASDIVQEVLYNTQENENNYAIDKGFCCEQSDNESWSSFGSKCQCSRPPLYLQWDGHSATIVGVEKTIRKKSFKESVGSYQNNCGDEMSYNMLVYDPNKEVRSLKAELKIAMKMKKFDSNIIRSLRMSMEEIKGNRCQIIVCSLRNVTYADRQRCRHTINSITPSIE